MSVDRRILNEEGPILERTSPSNLMLMLAGETSDGTILAHIPPVYTTPQQATTTVTWNGRLTAAFQVLEADTVGVRCHRHDEANQGTSTQIALDPTGSVSQIRVAGHLDSLGSLAATRSHHQPEIRLDNERFRLSQI